MKLAVKTLRDAGGYCRAWCPALPGCFAYAPSREEAVTRLQETIESYLASFDSAATATVDRVELTEAGASQKVGP